MKFSAHQDTEKGISGISVVSSGHIFAERGRRIERPLGRSDYLLFYVLRGRELFHLDRDITACEGSFVFFRPGEPQRHVYIGEGTGEFYYVHFNAPADFDLFGLESSRVYDASPSVEICDSFEAVIGELQMKQTAYEKVCVSRLFYIISLLVRRTEKEAAAGHEYFDKIYYVIQKMSTEYRDACTLDEYAEMCNLSKFHFLRMFKEITGASPIEYRNRIRIEHAKELLLYTNTPVGEIAAEVGYSSDTYFCDAFKTAVGVSPSVYRKNDK